MYAGTSGIFTAVPQNSVYSPIWSATAPVNSTLPIGSFVPKDYVGFPGYDGLIQVTTYGPEPSTFALTGFGAALLMIYRRRK
jgi:hypothetical protein